MQCSLLSWMLWLFVDVVTEQDTKIRTLYAESQNCEIRELDAFFKSTCGLAEDAVCQETKDMFLYLEML